MMNFYETYVQGVVDLNASDWSGFILLGCLPVLFVVYIFSELYTERYKLSLHEKIGIVFFGIAMGLMNINFGSVFITFLVWGILGMLFVIDWKYQELPDEMNLVLALLAIPTVISSFIKAESFTEWTLLSGLLLFIIFLSIALVSPMGGGDIKMMGAIGLYFPLAEVPQLIFFGFLVGALHGVYLLLFKGAGLNSQFAFGPGLIIGALLTTIL